MSRITVIEKQCCVVPVAAHDGVDWAAGKLQDVDLLTRSPLIPEGVFIVNLPDRHSYREALRLVLYWQQRGAVFLIARTGTSAVERHMELKNNCIRTFTENTDPIKHRFICPPDQFKKWVAKWGKTSLQRFHATGPIL